MFDHHCFGLVFFIFFYFAIRFWLLSFGFFLRTFSTVPSDGSQVCAGSRYRPSRLRSLIQVHGFGRGGKNVRKAAEQYAELIERRYGTAHSEYATALYYIAEVLRASNRLIEAEPLYREALAIGEKSLGADDPKLADVLGRLGELYFSQGRYGEAELPMKRLLLIREKALGIDHPDIALSLIYLAKIYREQARFSEAEPLMRRALALDEKSYGSDHPDVARDLNNLSELLQATNRLTEAEPLLRRALAIDEASLGKDHPNRGGVLLNNLAQLLKLLTGLQRPSP